jgi:citrate lyase subunit beta/citryl-CoA lyase
LFLPGNQPTMLQNGAVLPADVLIFDLEDSVAPTEKDAARELVASALRSVDYGERVLAVRINDLEKPYVKKDLETVVAAGAHSVMVPKVTGPHTIHHVAVMLDLIEEEYDIEKGRTKIIALIETALGIENAFGAATSSQRVEALALGGEDLCADLGCPRTKEGTEIFYSRSRLLIAARAAGIEAADTPFTDVRDEEGCYADTVFARSLGFDGKLSISPHHLRPIHRAFMPSQEAVAFALEVIEAMEMAKRESRGAVSLRGKMIDLPVLRQAEKTLELARASGMTLPEKEGTPS